MAAGSISSVTGSLTGGIKLGRDNWAGPAVRVVAGGIAGGISASIAGGRFAQGFAQGVIVNIMNHQLHAAGVEQVEPGEEEPPKCGDKVTYKGKYGEVSIFEYTGDGPYGGWTSIFYIGPYNAIQVTDSPIDWIIGAWKTPLQAVDDVAVLGFAKIVGGNSVPKVLQVGGQALKTNTLKTLNITKEQGRNAIHALKFEHGLGNSFHGKILSNGDYIHPSTGEYIDNLFNYIH
ncbi:MAG: hypothetical protein R2774_03715 [Saprospiraceae bacterium]